MPHAEFVPSTGGASKSFIVTNDNIHASRWGQRGGEVLSGGQKEATSDRRPPVTSDNADLSHLVNSARSGPPRTESGADEAPALHAAAPPGG
jgi:hypothetical protein